MRDFLSKSLRFNLPQEITWAAFLDHLLHVVQPISTSMMCVLITGQLFLLQPPLVFIPVSMCFRPAAKFKFGASPTPVILLNEKDPAARVLCGLQIGSI